jgi:hypothetical protein
MKQFLGTMAYGMSSLGEAVVDLGRSFRPRPLPVSDSVESLLSRGILARPHTNYLNRACLRIGKAHKRVGDIMWEAIENVQK